MADNDSRSGTTYAHPDVLRWLEQLHAPHDVGLQVAFDAPARLAMPQIQVGPAEGRLLELFARLVGARKIVEIGTLAGYSAIRLARGMPRGGLVWTFEVDPRHAKVARYNVAAAGLDERVTVLEGRATERLAEIEREGPFDLVFIDADKERYDEYGRWAAGHTRPGGLLLGDNAFFFGKLLEDTPGARAMRRFHEEAREHYETVCVPTPDGLLLGVRR
jgi:caffeoyl-CoA O-methyltransferase